MAEDFAIDQRYDNSVANAYTHVLELAVAGSAHCIANHLSS
jgi:hypothetical protein